MAKNIIAGRSIENLSRYFDKVYGKQYYSNAKRLIRAETAYVKGQADVLTYKKLGVDEYEILATLDKRTSKISEKKMAIIIQSIKSRSVSITRLFILIVGLRLSNIEMSVAIGEELLKIKMELQ